MRNLRCSSCDTTLLGSEALGPTPIGRDDCPRCGETEFHFVEE